MRSKKLKQTVTRSSPLSAAQICSEDELRQLAYAWVTEFRDRRPAGSAPRFLLLGEMGTGKSTLARALLEALGVDRAAEGSPTFAIAHEYFSEEGIRVIHADGYRLRSENELEQTGLLESLWDPNALVIFEWMDLFPVTMKTLCDSDLPVYEIRLSFVSGEQSATSRDPAKLRKVAVLLRE